MKSARQTNAPAKRKMKPGQKKYPIKRDSRISDILENVPDAAEIFALHGLHCAGCQFQTSDTLEEGMGLHGRRADHLDALIADLKTGLPAEKKRPKTIIVTKAAAQGLRAALKEQGKEDWMLVVMTDEAGGFCMEFVKDKTSDHLVFSHPDVQEVKVIATSMTLASVGGSVIDFREGRFKLDLPSTADGCACKQAV